MPSEPRTTMTASPKVSRRKRIVFALASTVVSFAVIGGTLLAIDMRLHRKYQTSAGFNVWGYRGPAAGRKQPGEYRIVVLGGSAAYGYGVEWNQAVPALLEQRLAPLAPAGRRYRVINLAYNNEGAYSFAATLRDYAYLDPELVFLYEGYNDLMGNPKAPNLSVFRHESPVFRLTGYLPIFPIVFREKAAAMLSGGDIGTLYRSHEKTVFRPGIATQAAAGLLQATAEVGLSLERQLDRARPEPRHGLDDIDSTGCRFPWGQYCQSVAAGVRAALAGGHQVLFASQPFLHARHVEQQREVAAMLARMFGGDSRVHYLNLGDAIDLSDPTLSFDHMHLTAEGNRRLTDRLVQPVAEIAAHGSLSASAPH